VVDVEHGGLRAFEQDALAGGAQRVEPLPHILGEGQDVRRHREQILGELRRVDRRLAESLAQRIVVRQQGRDLGRQHVGLAEVADADGAAADLVLVGRDRCRAASCRS
jgi:hypothetical protein